ncbi:MAG: tetratricopeptide repeat protein [Anaerolineaceae bacterium]|nr:tetratricopeptide repeat protein [Anaerolineaceae bacterium]
MTYPDFDSFGDLLKYLRRRARLTQKELSIATGYSESYISRLEKNQRPPDMAAISALFVPALDLENEPNMAALLLRLGQNTRSAQPPTDIPLPASPAIRPTHNLPYTLTTFIGRSHEITALTTHLSETRLITLTGPGGVGKTRLALHLATAVIDRYPDGVYLVELASLTDPALLLQTVSTAAGVPEGDKRPPLESLVAFLQPQNLLLILDNCEHLIAPAAELAETLLHHVPNLHILATSRETLNIPGEILFRVPPLRLPDAGWLESLQQLAQAEAVQLFLARARAVQPNFALTVENASDIVQICVRLDGLPLALELAAARLALLTPDQIAARLHARFTLLKGGSRTALPRHQTLDALIAWSYELLTEPERTLLHQVSVFVAGFSLEMLEAMAQNLPSELQSSLVDVLASLVNKSLVHAETAGNTTRYILLETIRHYAAAKREEAGETPAAKDRLLACLHAFAADVETGLRGPQQEAWLNRAQQELGNIRAALEWALADPQNKTRVARGMAVVFNLGYFWVRRGRTEWQAWMARCAALPDPPFVPAYCQILAHAAMRERNATNSATLFARAMDLAHRLKDEACLASIHFYQAGSHWWAEPAKARTHYERAASIYRALNRPWYMAEALLYLGELLQIRFDDFVAAKVCLEEAMTLFRQAGDSRHTGLALAHLGDIALEQGNLAKTEAYCQEALEIARALNDSHGASWAFSNLSLAAMGRGEFGTAVSLGEESLALELRLGFDEILAMRRYRLGMAYLFRGDYTQAEACFRQNLAMKQAREILWGIPGCSLGLGELARRQGDWARARSRLEAAFKGFQEMEYKYGLAATLERLAHLAVDEAQFVQAARLFAAADHLRMSYGMALLPVEQAAHDQAVATIQELLPEAEYQRTIASVNEATVQEIVAWAGQVSSGGWAG